MIIKRCVAILITSILSVGSVYAGSYANSTMYQPDWRANKFESKKACYADVENNFQRVMNAYSGKNMPFSAMKSIARDGKSMQFRCDVQNVVNGVVNGVKGFLTRSTAGSINVAQVSSGTVNAPTIVTNNFNQNGYNTTPIDTFSVSLTR
jgi:hypothetical protein